MNDCSGFFICPKCGKNTIHICEKSSEIRETEYKTSIPLYHLENLLNIFETVTSIDETYYHGDICSAVQIPFLIRDIRYWIKILRDILNEETKEEKPNE